MIAGAARDAMSIKKIAKYFFNGITLQGMLKI